MKNRFVIRFLWLSLLTFFSFSCSSELDFEQSKDFAVQPVYTTNLTSITAKESDFVFGGIPLPPVTQRVDVAFFEKSFIQNELIKAEMFFRIKNSINSAFNFDIVFLSENNSILNRIPLRATAATGTESLLEYPVVFEGADLQALKQTRHILFSISMLPGAAPSGNSQARVELTSSITAYLNLK